MRARKGFSLVSVLVAGGAVALALFLATGQWRGVRQARDDAAARVRLGEELPLPDPTGTYVSSDHCRSCHPSQYDSWHRTFHRTMTQHAVPENVLGRFDGTTIQSDGLAYRVFRKGDEFWAEMPDPDVIMYVIQGGRNLPLDQIPRVEQRVVMATGSHHYQTYWVDSPRHDRLLQTLPLVYLPADQRWIPREAAFMRAPDDRGRFITQWNHHCIRCHSTGGNPGLNKETGMLDTSVGELGIACESCHGPAGKHVALHRDPLKRYRNHLDNGDDDRSPRNGDGVVNPEKLDHRASSQVCGQCHGVFTSRDEFAMKYAYEGILYRPGDDLHKTRYYVQHPSREPSPERLADLERNPDFFRERWWDDGTILAGGREFTAMSVSRCYTEGTLSCLSCHSMHGHDPVDQLKPDRTANAACTQCHDAPRFTADVRTHTFHDPRSGGSNCLNCHMPHTTYALLGAIRSHQIESPHLRASAEFGVPNACNLCHLDKTLHWTQEHLVERYGQARVPLSEEQQTVSAALLWMLKGHAAQRAITAWHVGWDPAQTASGTDWLAPFQAVLLADPYGVVRYVADKGLQTLPGFDDFQFDFLADQPELDRRAQAAVDLWKSAAPPVARGAEILIDGDGKLLEQPMRALLRQRDNRRVTIKE